jgi:hypothetical protein
VVVAGRVVHDFIMGKSHSPHKSRNAQTVFSPKPKKQPETQFANVESLNFSRSESRNKKTQTQNPKKKPPKPTSNKRNG